MRTQKWDIDTVRTASFEDRRPGPSEERLPVDPDVDRSHRRSESRDTGPPNSPRNGQISCFWFGN
jgi:hypothetical protein